MFLNVQTFSASLWARARAHGHARQVPFAGQLKDLSAFLTAASCTRNVFLHPLLHIKKLALFTAFYWHKFFCTFPCILKFFVTFSHFLIFLTLLSKAQITHNIFAHNIEIKRHCNKKIKRHFSSNIFFPVWIENIYF